MKKVYSVDKYDLDELYDEPFIDSNEERLATLGDRHIKGYRCKTIRSGDQLECEIYPVWDTKSSTRAPKCKESRAAQRNLNRKNAVKKVVRLINTNFEPNKDIWVHLTYDDLHLPTMVDGAIVEMQKYIRRIKCYIKKHKLPELKYLYVTEGGENTKKRLHHHIVMNFEDRDVAEQLWHCGGYPRANRLRVADKRFKFEGMAIYIGKDPSGNKRFVASRNLKQPDVTVADCKFTRKRVNDLIQGKKDAKTIFEKFYKKYEFNDINTYTSEYTTGGYVYVRMRRRQ